MSRVSYESIGEQFSAIAKRYDSINQILSFGIHHYWRKVQVAFVVNALLERFPSAKDINVLDIATGTYDVACALQKQRTISVLGVDASFGMLYAGLPKIQEYPGITPIQTDAKILPLKKESVEAITISFGLRNMYPRVLCFQEWFRVLKKGGVLAIVEFNNPNEVSLVMRYGYKMYLRYIFPLVSFVLGLDKSMYKYLAESICAFPFSQGIVKEGELAGFHPITVRKLTGGIVSLYCFEKKSDLA